MAVSENMPAADARSDARSSLYLSAALYCDGRSTPARVRNMSASGALVEAAVLPDVGTLVQLVRGKLIVHGPVVWAQAGRCGIEFAGSVEVDQWRAAPGNSEQQRVDEVVTLVKAGTVPLDRSRGAASLQSAVESAAIPLEDLARVSALLDALGTVLARDAIIVANYGPALQNIDISVQLIAALSSAVSHPSEIRTDLISLRRSADQALASSL
jgi:hypothetical protein